MSTTIENYCIDCKAVAQPDCEQRGHVVGTLGSTEPDVEPEPGSTAASVDDYRNAPSGVGPLADEWKDKPHRLVYDLCQMNAALVAERDRLLESDRFLGDRLEAQAETMARVVAERNNLRIERERLREALRQIAAFNDEGANVALRKHGSYSGFDEPGAVQVAREALAGTEQGGETR